MRPGQGLRRRAGALAFVVGLGLPSMLVLALAGCAYSTPDPFAAAGSPREGVGSELRRVRFQVACDGCEVSWSVGLQSGSARQQVLFSEEVRVRLDPEEVVTARLAADPDAGRPPVRWVRIRVDGVVVAEAETRPGRPGRLVVEAEVRGDPDAQPGGRVESP